MASFLDRMLRRRPADLGVVGPSAVDLVGRTASVAPVADGGPSGLFPMPGKRQVDPRQERARFYSRRIGWVRNAYRFMAFQAARCPWTIEVTENGVDWQVLPMGEPGSPEAWAWSILGEIRAPRGGLPELTRKGVFLDDTVGEFYIVDRTGVGVERPEDAVPMFDVVDVNAASETKTKGQWVISEVERGRVEKGTAYLVDDARVYRHWQEDEEWPLVATSSLIGMTDDVDTYWTLIRQLRRESRSALAMRNLFWSPSEAHVQTVQVNGRSVSVFDREYANMAARSVNDEDDANVASVAPIPVNTPSTFGAPQVIEIPSMGPDLLAYIRDSRDVVASGVPLSLGAIVASQQADNHWDAWLGDEKDTQTISERLRRVQDSWSAAVLRPVLRAGMAAGVWSGNPEHVRFGAKTDVLRRTVDNAENAKWAWAQGLIDDEAARRETHFTEADAPTPEEFAVTIERRTAITTATAAPAAPGGPPAAPELGAGTSAAGLPAGGPVPNNGIPVPPEAATATAGVTASVAVIDDRWLFQ